MPLPIHSLIPPCSVAMVDLSRILRRPQQQARRVYDKPARERHFLSIICSVLSSIFLIMALALKVWASGHNEQCSYVFGLTQVYIVPPSDQPTISQSSKPINPIIHTMYITSYHGCLLTKFARNFIERGFIKIPCEYSSIQCQDITPSPSRS